LEARSPPRGLEAPHGEYAARRANALRDRAPMDAPGVGHRAPPGLAAYALLPSAASAVGAEREKKA